MKKVKRPRPEKRIAVLEEKQIKEATGSSGYMVAWGFEELEENGPH
ncbi:MAG TPA: hypothetical protein VJ725_03375 [Thermoanaerobaculia bacterium]|nr:hypothetical protein [Thermoanaerobaculia bacterium]